MANFSPLKAMTILTALEEQWVVTILKHKSLWAESVRERRKKKKEKLLVVLRQRIYGWIHQEYKEGNKEKWSKKQWGDINLSVWEHAVLNELTGSGWWLNSWSRFLCEGTKSGRWVDSDVWSHETWTDPVLPKDHYPLRFTRWMHKQIFSVKW